MLSGIRYLKILFPIVLILSVTNCGRDSKSKNENKEEENSNKNTGSYQLHENYISKKWGKIKFKLEEDNKVKAVYVYSRGTFKGTIDPSTGIIKGTWCEAPNRKKYRGPAEFRIVKNKNVDIEGKWAEKNKHKEGCAHKWHNDWDLVKYEGSITRGIVDFDDDSKFCGPPISPDTEY